MAPKPTTPGGLKRRRSRRAENHKFRLRKPHWVDPFPGIPGTLPEKMLFAQLVRKRIFFLFQGSLRDYVGDRSPILQDREFEPDILIPEYKVILDPFGEFAHTQDDSIARDQWKSVYYRGLGYAFYHPWASEVDRDPIGVIERIPELRGRKTGKLSPKDLPFLGQGYRLGPNLGAGAKGTGAGNTARAAHTLKVGRSLRVGRSIRRSR